MQSSLKPQWSSTNCVVLNAPRDAEPSNPEKPLEYCGRECVFSDQILRLRPQNDTNCSTPLILFNAITTKPSCGSSPGATP
ncbi:MAG: hypothetical protein CL694_13565 [Chloroflexi bacterium]|nr:hypothetical protein [Chloroflexota bacterium]